MDRVYLIVRRVMAAAWRQRWLLVATSWGLCIVGWGGVYAIPDNYESSARLYVDADAILTPLLRGLAIDNSLAAQIDVLQKTLLSRPNLEKLIDTTSLNAQATDPQRRERLTQELSRDIKTSPEGRNLYTISYRNRDPQLAREVVTALVNIFTERATGSNRADMANAQKFLNQQIVSYEAQLRAAEQRRVEFRRKYADILPLEGNGGLSRLDGARGTVRDLELQLRDVSARRDALQAELRKTLPTLTAGPQDAAAAAEARLTELRSRLTEDHPDVITTRKLIATLRANPRRSDLAASSLSDGNRPPMPNPVYEQIKVRLLEADGSVAAVQARLDSARTGLSRMEELTRAAPQVEAEFQNLNRDYNVLQKNYEELLARRESSNLTAAADTGADKVRLRIIDPPKVPTMPVAPNRILLISLVFLAALGASAALPILLSQTDESINDIGQLRELGCPVLGGISLLSTTGCSRQLFSQALPVGASAVLLLFVYGGLAAHIIRSSKAVL
jgi:polysaccharide chain length determinant protein (PEP-CTERM system associated)